MTTPVRITADQARALAGPRAIDHVEAAYPLIRVAAERGNYFIRLRGFWANEGYEQKVTYKEACEILRKDGFKVEYFHDDKQLADFGTEISWY